MYTDVAMEHDYKTRCVRQLLCMQLKLRAYLLERVHYDGDPTPFGEYTMEADEWSRFNSGGCDEAVLNLPPSRCDEGLPAERSALTCAELKENHAPSEEEEAEEEAEEEVWSRASHTPPACAASGGDCLQSGCCAAPGQQCYTTLLGTAHCKAACHADDTWACAHVSVSSPPPPPPPTGPDPFASVGEAQATVRWQRPSKAGVCAESAARAIAGSGSATTASTRSHTLGCPAPLTHSDARDFCHAQGARLCTADELSADAAAGSGCDRDGARVWSSDFCAEGDKHFVSLGGSAEAIQARTLPIRRLCLHRDNLLPPRCCADEQQPSLAPTFPSSSSAASTSPSSAAAVASAAAPVPSPLTAGKDPSPPPPTCTSNYGNCYFSRCCAGMPYHCFVHHHGIKYAQCRPSCPADGSWACTLLEPVGPSATSTATSASAAEPSYAASSSSPPSAGLSSPLGGTARLPEHFTSPPSLDALERAKQEGGVQSGAQQYAGGSRHPDVDRHPDVEDFEGRLGLLAAGVLAFVVTCGGGLCCLWRSAQRREVVRERAMGTTVGSTRLKVDLRSRSSLTGARGQRSAAYIQMAPPNEA